MKKYINIFYDKYQYLHDSLLALLSHLRHTMFNPIKIPSITPTSSFSLQSVDEDDELELGDRNSGLITAYYEDINTSSPGSAEDNNDTQKNNISDNSTADPSEIKDFKQGDDK